jgi:hypothetical protein
VNCFGSDFAPFVHESPPREQAAIAGIAKAEAEAAAARVAEMEAMKAELASQMAAQRAEFDAQLAAAQASLPISAHIH